jgi:hypothetical protein
MCDAVAVQQKRHIKANRNSVALLTVSIPVAEPIQKGQKAVIQFLAAKGR